MLKGEAALACPFCVAELIIGFYGYIYPFSLIINLL